MIFEDRAGQRYRREKRDVKKSKERDRERKTESSWRKSEVKEEGCGTEKESQKRPRVLRNQGIEEAYGVKKGNSKG